MQAVRLAAVSDAQNVSSIRNDSAMTIQEAEKMLREAIEEAWACYDPHSREEIDENRRERTERDRALDFLLAEIDRFKDLANWGEL